ncbi:MAG: hypothetical protein E2O29_01910 [Deltaproteobacteria bacterium]|nr:MAG: hypothetical protein E2O29_01910 [Deltaproteobacteria bacterium]
MKKTHTSFNTQLHDQLRIAIEEKLIKLRYPAHYKKWKKKFDYWFNLTKDLNQTLDIMYGPGGSADNYKGSIYRNSNLDIKAIEKPKTKQFVRKHNKPKSNNKSSAFAHIRLKQGGTNETHSL